MVAYSFKSFFSPQIVAGTKRQTIRGDRARHARPGERIQLYQGMRTKYCTKIIEDQICTAVMPIEILLSDLINEIVARIAINGRPLRYPEIEEFARLDGFAPELLTGSLPARLIGRTARETMGRFWRQAHGDISRFHGVLITWEPA
ncbi:ASCH domain-containing protein [Mycoplana ramosa]|uniref:ASCH domain-containing protein n=1 Tax=Mycoplana ramosa TaxID=40837 RepID=A0ABW3Z1W4_MYCRA